MAVTNVAAETATEETEEKAKAPRRRTTVPTDLAEYKTLVRDTAIKVAGEQGWCDEGLNKVLRKLNLDPKPAPRTFYIDVPLTVTVRYEATVMDEAAAREQVRRYIDYDARQLTGGYRRIEYGTYRDVNFGVDAATVTAQRR